MNRVHDRLAPLLISLLLGAAVSGCSITIDDVTGRGVGALCSASSDCHAGACVDGLCTAPCAYDVDCPAPSECIQQACAVPLRVSALWEGVVANDEGWNVVHHEAMQYAATKLPYLKWDYKENVSTAVPGEIGRVVDERIHAGAQVIIGDSFGQQDDLLNAADRHPGVKFLVAGGSTSNGRNLVSFYAYYEQAWYAAGKLAASKAKKRVGVIVDAVTPEQVREANAFALGARSVNPDLIVEVAWIGFWLDYNTQPLFEYHGEMLFREELLAARLIDSGCEVIAHNSDVQRTVRYVDRKVSSGAVSGVWTFADNNPDGCRTPTQDGLTGPAMKSCLGAAYYNFGGMYVRLLDGIHRGGWDASKYLLEPMTNVPETSPVGIEINPESGIDPDSARSILHTIAARGPQAVFAGPYAVNGQRDRDHDGKPDAVQSVAPGEVLSDDEYNRICWFVKGLVQKVDPLDPHSADVDALVPDGDVAPPPDLLGAPGAPPGAGFKCSENL